MIVIRPIRNNIAVCPECHSEQTITKKVCYPGIHIVAECQCLSCQYEFLQDLPVGHACYYPISIGLKDNKVFDSYSIDWYTKQFVQSFKNKEEEHVKVERIILKHSEDVILINCLDYLYGHVLLKLFNISFYKEKNPQKGIIIIVPANFKWLVPSFVDEIWTVDLKLNEFKKYYSSIDEQILIFVDSFKSVSLAYTYPHPVTENIQIEDYSQRKPFDLESFCKKPLTVTYIYRMDRLWHQSKLEYYLFVLLRKIKILKFCKFLFPGLQNRCIKKLEQQLRKKFPDLVFNVAGIGNTGRFPASINDLRSAKPDINREIQWCKVYAESHVVIGIHGSNMLLPTAHSASFIELLPTDRVGNLTQDIVTKYTGRTALFLGRFIQDRSSPAFIADHVESIFKGWKSFYLYNHSSNQLFNFDFQNDFIKRLRKH
jgi:hypothetical protein